MDEPRDDRTSQPSASMERVREHVRQLFLRVKAHIAARSAGGAALIETNGEEGNSGSVGDVKAPPGPISRP